MLMVTELSVAEKKTTEWLDNQDLMSKLHLSSRTLQKWRDEGTIPFTKIGNKIYYSQSDIEDLLLANVQKIAS